MVDISRKKKTQRFWTALRELYHLNVSDCNYNISLLCYKKVFAFLYEVPSALIIIIAKIVLICDRDYVKHSYDRLEASGPNNTRMKYLTFPGTFDEKNNVWEDIAKEISQSHGTFRSRRMSPRSGPMYWPSTNPLLVIKYYQLAKLEVDLLKLSLQSSRLNLNQSRGRSPRRN